MGGSGTCRTPPPLEVCPWWTEVGAAVFCAWTLWPVVDDAVPCSRTPWSVDSNVPSLGRTPCSPEGVVVAAAVLLAVPRDPTAKLLLSSPSTVPGSGGSASLLDAPLGVAGGGDSLALWP